MPTYRYKNRETGELISLTCTIEEMLKRVMMMESTETRCFTSETIKQNTLARPQGAVGLGH